MKIATTLALCAGAALACVAPALAQAPRADAIWARRTNATITLNGILNEPAWA